MNVMKCIKNIDWVALGVLVLIPLLMLAMVVIFAGCGDSTTETNVTVHQTCINERHACDTDGEMSSAMCTAEFDQCNADISANNDTDTDDHSDNSSTESVSVI